MLLNSVIIVLREVLEAALMISVLLAASRLLRLRTGWLGGALLLGGVGATAYGLQLERISELLGGVGQEVANAGLQFIVFIALLICLFLIVRKYQQLAGPHGALPLAMAIAVSVAIAREGAEILVYVSGFVQAEHLIANVGVGSVIGACIGLSAGVLLYYVLLMLPPRRSRIVIQALLALIGAGMSAQATRLLIQADWLSVEGALWDTSAVLSEDSIAGQLLYALIGYEASPSTIEVIVYAGSLLLMGAAVMSARVLFSNRAVPGQ
jgi:high-affinity iron transporter